MSHLDDARLFELRSVAADPAEVEHLDGCTRCRSALSRVHAALDADALEAPSIFETRRALRDLDGAINAEIHRQRSAWRPQRVALVTLIAAFSGAAVAFTATRLDPVAPEAPARAPVRASVEAPGDDRVELSDPAPMAEVEPPKAAPSPRTRRRAPVALQELPPCANGWAEVAAARNARGAPAEAADAWVNALCGAEARVAADALQSMVRGGLVEAREVTERIDANPSARLALQGLRLPCAFGLRYHGDTSAIDRCDAFFRAYPSDPAVRELGLAAGVVAERNGLPERALDAYDRVISVSSGGVASAPALLRRAQLRLRQGDQSAARADFRLYLDARPDARERPAVQELAQKLGL